MTIENPTNTEQLLQVKKGVVFTPFKELNSLPGRIKFPYYEVANIPIEFEGIKGFVVLFAVSHPDKVVFDIPLGPVRNVEIFERGEVKWVEAPLGITMKFVVTSLEQMQLLLDHYAELYLNGQLYDLILMDQDQIREAENLLEVTGEAVVGGVQLRSVRGNRYEYTHLPYSVNLLREIQINIMSDGEE